MSTFLQKLKLKEGKVVILNYIFPYDVNHPRTQVARVIEVGMDYYVIETFEEGIKKQEMYTYPTQGLWSIQLNADKEEIEFQRNEFEYLSKKEMPAKFSIE